MPPKKVEEEKESIEIPVRQEPDVNAMIIETYRMTKELLEIAKQEE